MEEEIQEILATYRSSINDDKILFSPHDLLGFFEPVIPVRRPGWEWVDCAVGGA